MINALLDFTTTPIHEAKKHIIPEEVYITLFLLEYRLLMFVIYRGHTDHLQHLWRFKQQCRATIESDALLLKQFMLLQGIAYDWYCTLDGFTNPIWAGMKEGFLREQMTYRHNPEFLRNIGASEIRRDDRIP